jgi:dynein heavy chain
MFGGLDSEKKNGKVAPNNQVWTIRIGKNCDIRLQQVSGDVPLPRTNHSACFVPPDKIVVFGGYYTTNQRFNDTYILKTSNYEWKQPDNQQSG